MSLNTSMYIHLRDDTSVSVMRNTAGDSISADIILDGDVTLFVSSHVQISNLLRALAEASKMIPVHAQVEA